MSPLPFSHLQVQALDAFGLADLTGKIMKTNSDPVAYGGSSDVYTARFIKDTGMKLAVKVMRPTVDDAALRRIKRQIRVWKPLDHENIVPFLGVCHDFHGLLPGLVSPFFANGNIIDYLKLHRNASKFTFIQQTAAALLYLHSRGIVHGDIKGGNVLINDNRDACLVDFGLSRILRESGFTTNTTLQTLRFTAPEIYELGSREEVDGVPPVVHDITAVPKFTTESDVWAFAMFVIQVFTGLKPFSHIPHDASICQYVLTDGRPRRIDCSEINDIIWDKLCECWKKSPRERLSMEELSNFLSSL